ncbi:MAG: hypothetical protein E6H07_05955 [Bacteroidetes bacterium]|nr:MAG: hypothetical protein E6H07_05955 [Bacteroidota bacterium]
MQLVKLTIEKNFSLRIALIGLLSMAYCQFATAQDNSPYSRYGIGDLSPSTNVISRGMGRISAGYTDFLAINFSNPASYAHFQSLKEARSNKLQSGRVLFDVGINYDRRTLREADGPEKFVAQNAFFSYMQVGMPLSSKWGLTFGIRPVSRISYEIEMRERVQLTNTTDSVLTVYKGDGGAYLPNIGTAVKLGKFSIGVNTGYLFGKKEYSTRRGFVNDTIEYNPSNHESNATYGSIFLQGGLQYKHTTKNKINITLGATGNLGTTLNAHEDRVVETFTRTTVGLDLRLDSVYTRSDVKGTMQYPGSFTFGFTIGSEPEYKRSNWMFGADFTATAWGDYRYYGQTDFTQDTWQANIGGQFRPAAGNGYFSNVTYRAGLFGGPDYINTGKSLTQFGATFGMGLPIANYNRLAGTQATIINFAFEYTKRGNNSNVLKEDVMRISFGLSLSDLWFTKQKYE